MQFLSKIDILTTLRNWYEAWNRHDFDQVMDFFHKDIVFEHWTGKRIQGKGNLYQEWYLWFKNHGNFHFSEEDTFVDKDAQKALYRWQLTWPSFEKRYRGKLEMRRGVDVFHFEDQKIIKKMTYSKTSIDIEKQIIKLTAL